jgi:hypothetical protein
MPEVTGSLIAPRQSAAPASPVTGQLYYDTDDNTLYWWNGAAWIPATATGGGGGAPSGPAGGDLSGSYPNPTVVKAAGNFVHGGVDSWAGDTYLYRSGAGILTTEGILDALGMLKVAGSEVVYDGKAAGGDLAGTYPNPDIKAGAIVNADISASALIDGRKMDINRQSVAPTDAVSASGDLWIYPFTGGYWMFIFDSTEATYKWKFVGGPPLRVNIATDETFVDDSTYRDCATVGPVVTLPRDGDYYFQSIFGGYIATQPAGAHQIGSKVTISNGSLENNDSSIAVQHTQGGVGVTCYGQGVNLSAIAGATLKLQYVATNTTGTPHARWRMLAVWPIRVAGGP